MSIEFNNQLGDIRQKQADKIASRPDLWTNIAAAKLLADPISDIEEFKYKNCPHCESVLVWVAAGIDANDFVIDCEFECYECNRSLTYNFINSQWTYSEFISDNPTLDIDL